MKRRILSLMLILCLCLTLIVSLASCAGEAGPMGPKGEKGDIGATGAQGEKGATGAQGEQGVAGAVGPAGQEGKGIQNIEVAQTVEDGQTYMVFTVTYTDSTTKVEKVLISEPQILVTNTEEAQAALDNAKAGDVIRLAPGSYGTLYLRQSEISTKVDISDWAGNGDVERFRSFENITILGGENVEVEGIHVEACNYAGTHHSNSAKMPHLSSYISIKNLTIKDIDLKPLTGKTMFNMSGANLEVDGLHFDGCTLTYNDLTSQSARLIYQGSDTVSEVKDRWNGGEVFMTNGSVQNISITNCTVKNAHQILELRNAKNITISGNNFINTRARDILLTMGSKNIKFSGNITITDNFSTNSTERFARINGVNGIVTVSGNVVLASDAFNESLIKITNHNGSLITFKGNTWNGYNDQDAIRNGLVEK